MLNRLLPMTVVGFVFTFASVSHAGLGFGHSPNRHGEAYNFSVSRTHPDDWTHDGLDVPDDGFSHRHGMRGGEFNFAPGGAVGGVRNGERSSRNWQGGRSSLSALEGGPSPMVGGGGGGADDNEMGVLNVDDNGGASPDEDSPEPGIDDLADNHLDDNGGEGEAPNGGAPDPSAVPEPATFALWSLAAIALFVVVRRKE